MKKVLATAILAVSAATAFADSVSLEGQHIDNVNSNAQTQYILKAQKDLVGSLLGADLQFNNAQTQNTEALSTRLEAGLTGSLPAGPIGVYTRVSVGEKYTNTTNFGYYTIEPGVTAPVPGVAGLSVKAGWRYRSAFNADVNNDQTHTGRIGVNYAFTKTDTIGVRYDRVNGDNDQKIYAATYTRSF